MSLTGRVVEFHPARGWARVLGADGQVYVAEVTEIETPLAVGDAVAFTAAPEAHAATVRRTAP